MICNECGKDSAVDFSFCPHCGKQKITQNICPSCAREFSVEFSFCPHCGNAFHSAPPISIPVDSSPEVESVDKESTDEQILSIISPTSKFNEIGTYTFGAFAAITLVVAIVHGIRPIELIETAIWAGSAWYWHSKKTHSELAKAVILVIAALVAIGEIISVVHHYNEPDTNSRQANHSSEIPVPPGYVLDRDSGNTYNPQSVPQSSATESVAGIEEQAVTFYKQKHYSDARPLFDEACTAGEMKACNYLGYLYALGLGGTRNTKKARDVYQRACDQGTLASCASLGTLYQDAGESGNARKYFQKACDGGVAEACGLLRGVQ